MMPLMISDTLAEELQRLADDERTSVDSILRELLDSRRPEPYTYPDAAEALESPIKIGASFETQDIDETTLTEEQRLRLKSLRRMEGIIDSEEPDLSMRVKEIVHEAALKRYEDVQNTD